MRDERKPLPKLPHSREAERAVLGAILLNSDSPHNTIRVALEHLSSGDFFIDSHRTIFQRMAGMAEAKQPIDLVTLVEELKSRGELEAAGGPAYIAALPDGIPRVSNMQHYAKIVHDRAIRRILAHVGERLTETALMPNARMEDIGAQLQGLPKIISPSRQTGGLMAVTADAFLEMQLPVREMMLDPVLATQSLSLLYSKRGVGKTFFAIGIAHTIATGGSLFGWSAPKPRSVLFVDGELPGRVLQDRISVIVGRPSKTNLKLLRIITPDLQSGQMPDLATREGQELVESHLDEAELLILDNLSALCRTGKENEGEGWLPVQEWALKLRQRGVAVLFVHHAGKAGAQRGTSRREDVLDLVLALRHPTDYAPTEGLRCELHFEKCRSLLGEGAKPFEVRLQADATGVLVWTTRPIDDVLLSRATELFRDGVSVRDAAEELQISKSKVQRLKAKLKRTSELE